MQSIETINGNNIYDYFISGAKRLMCCEKALNSINVFPVADGDTGTNLSLTMKMVVMKSQKNPELHRALSSISKVAVENAYGNSGMIFAQFLNGFAIEADGKDSISVDEFADIARKAADHAYSAVASPKEGTILTVIRDWSNELKSTIHLDDFNNIFHNSVEKANTFVEKTKSKMKVFIENNVVDAGAKGFVIFLEGINEFLSNGKVSEEYVDIDSDFAVHENNIKVAEITKNRYCSQFYIDSKKSNDDLKKNLSAFGDSLVVTGGEGRLKIHIHTDNPDDVMEYLLAENEVISHEIEDMKIMSDIISRRKNKIALVTDSISDIPQEIIDDEQIFVVPLNLICDSVLYLDKITMTTEKFYKKLAHFKMNPTSAQPTISRFEKSFKMLLEHFDSIIGIFISKKLSGTYNNAVSASKRLSKTGKKISIIDSKLMTNAEGLLVTEAAKLINKDLKHDDIVEKLNKLKENTKILISLKDLTSLIRGGRISKTLGFILSKIRLQPVISADKNGSLYLSHKTLSRKSAVKKIIEQIKKDKQESGIKSYSIVYSDSEVDIVDFKKQIKNEIGFEPDYVTQISPVIGINSGTGAFAVSYVKGNDGI